MKIKTMWLLFKVEEDGEERLRGVKIPDTAMKALLKKVDSL